MASSEIKVKPKYGWESHVLAPGIDLHICKDAKLAMIRLYGYMVNGTSAGNAGALAFVTPIEESYLTPVGIEGSSAMGIFRIYNFTRLDLLSENLGSYTSGKIYGTLVFHIE